MPPKKLTYAQLKSRNNNLIRQKSYAWAMYYKEIEQEYNLAYDNYEINVSIMEINNEEKENILPNCLICEIEEMSAKLKKIIDCPVCMEIIKKGELVITGCGHKYCKTCYKNPLLTKCAICRKKLHKK